MRINQCRTALSELPDLLNPYESYPLLEVVSTNRTKLFHVLRDIEDPTDEQVRIYAMQIRRTELVTAASNLTATTDDTSFFDSLPMRSYKRMPPE